MVKIHNPDSTAHLYSRIRQFMPDTDVAANGNTICKRTQIKELSGEARCCFLTREEARYNFTSYAFLPKKCKEFSLLGSEFDFALIVSVYK